MGVKMKKTISLVLVLALCMATEVAKADFVFGEPTNLGPPVNGSYHDLTAYISSDSLSLYFASDRPGGFGDWDLWVTTRPSKDSDWSEPVNLGPVVNNTAGEIHPGISADGLMLYFTSDRSGGLGEYDLWVTTRQTTEDPWAKPVNLGPPINSSTHEGWPCISADDCTLYFSSFRSGGYGQTDMWMSKRPTPSDHWSEPVNLGPLLNSPQHDSGPFISADGRILLFDSARITGMFDIYMTSRETTDSPWTTPVNLEPPINSSTADIYPCLSPDGRTLYFSGHFMTSPRPGGVGGADLWQAPILPIVDLNGDGVVDSADMCIIIDHWGEDYSLCDIGPIPWGDGIIDVQDMIVLVEHLFEEVDDPTLISHWPLDEVQGVIAYDNAADCDGTLMGGPVWQPNNGIVAGALQFDSIDDYVRTARVLNPVDGAFSALAWIKGGIPGQVVLSQAGAANWLCTDSVEGCLMTELTCPGRSGGPLLSQRCITDGEWHRIGLVWDGPHRTLYIDSVMVAKDVQNGLVGSNNGLYIGCGKSREPSTFFSGLIDDVRIYNRVVSP